MRRRDPRIGLGGLALAPTARRWPGRVAAQPATPTTGGDPAGLAEMLAFAPDTLAGPNAPVARIAQYANPALQLATLGEPPGGTDFSA